jgi:hypothetical protein
MRTTVTSAYDAVSVGLYALAIVPHMLFLVLGLIFNFLGWLLNFKGGALTGAIMYCIAALMSPLRAFFVVAQIILSFAGHAGLRAMDQRTQATEVFDSDPPSSKYRGPLKPDGPTIAMRILIGVFALIILGLLAYGIATA